MAAAEHYQDLAQELAVAEGIRPSSMFGMPTLKAGSRAFAGLTGEAMVFKLSGDAHGRALGLPGAHLFEPMEGRPMREWVVVPEAEAGRWPELARAALAYVRGS